VKYDASGHYQLIYDVTAKRSGLIQKDLNGNYFAEISKLRQI